MLLDKLANAKKQANEDLGGFDNRKTLKFTVQKGFNPDDLRKISTGIEFVSQEYENCRHWLRHQYCIDPV